MMKLAGLAFLGMSALVSGVTVTSVADKEMVVEDREAVKKLNGFSKFQLDKLFRSWLLIKQHKSFLKLPNLSLGCSGTTGNVEVGNTYTLTQYDGCVARDYRLILDDVQYQDQFEDDTIIPIITTASYRFFNEKIRQPSILQVSSNGIVTVGYTTNGSLPLGNLDTAAAPLRVIAPLWTDLKPDPAGNARVYWGYFRRGKSVKCTGLQWYDFITQTSDAPVDFQLDICSNGVMTARYQLAADVDPLQVGIKKSDGITFDSTYLNFGLGFSFPDNSAIVMSYTN